MSIVTTVLYNELTPDTEPIAPRMLRQWRMRRTEIMRVRMTLRPTEMVKYGRPKLPDIPYHKFELGLETS